MSCFDNQSLDLAIRNLGIELEDIFIDAANPHISNKLKVYVRAIIYNPATDLYLFAHFPFGKNTSKWGLVGGRLESQDHQLELYREISEETGFIDIQACVSLGGKIYSPRDPEFDDVGVVKLNIPFLVIIDPKISTTADPSLSQGEQKTGLNLQWKKPNQVNFDGYYKQNQVMLQRAVKVIEYIKTPTKQSI
jgi:hypothetical protein